jgi:hypothetical protein
MGGDAMSHTPGPWTTGPEVPNVYNDKGSVVAVTNPHMLTEEEQWANAQLISAAPDLLKALEVLVFLTEVPIRNFGVAVEAFEDARAALKKAGGKP